MLSKDYTVRQLSPADEGSIQALCERCWDFSMLIEGRMPEKNAGRDILFDLPPNKELKDKYVLGAYREADRLIAVIELVKDYKVPGEWIIGLMLIDPDERGKGLGNKLHEYIKTMVSQAGGRLLRLGVAEENYRAYKFWSELGYREIDRVNMTYGNKEHTVIVMNLSL